MRMFRTVSAKDTTPEEIAQVREAIEELPEGSELRAFITELLNGLDLGLNMTVFSTPPVREYTNNVVGYAGFTVIPDTV